MDIFQEILAEFKTQESQRALFILSKDQELQAVISSWGPDVIVRVVDNPLAPITHEDSDDDKWKWLWSNVVINEEKLLNRSKTIHGKAKLLIAIGFRLIYPDGTLHSLVEGFIINQIVKAMGGEGKRDRDLKFGKGN